MVWCSLKEHSAHRPCVWPWAVRVWVAEKGVESSQRTAKASLSITQGRGKFLERKQEARGPTLDRPGWELSLFSPPTIGTQCLHCS